MLKISPNVKPRPGAVVFHFYGMLALLALLVLGIYYRLPVVIFTSAAVILVGLGSRLWASFSLRGVSVAEEIEATNIFAGEITAARLTVINAKFWPLAWLEVTRPGTERLRLIGSPYRKDVAGRVCCRLGWLLWQQEASWHYQLRALRRGNYPLGPLALTSGDPFGFYRQEKEIPAHTRLLVYPPLLPLAELHPSWADPLGEKHNRNFLYSDPAYISGVRDYQPGDPIRQINWTATAKTLTLKSNILEGSAAARVILVLAAGGLEVLDWPPDKKELAFELLVAACASLAVSLAEAGVEVGLAGDCRPQPGLAPGFFLGPASGKNPAHLQSLLATLATVEAATGLKLPLFLRRQPLPARAHLVVLAPAWPASNPEEWPPLIQKNRLLWLLLEDGGVPEAAAYNCIFPGWQENEALKARVLIL